MNSFNWLFVASVPIALCLPGCAATAYSTSDCASNDEGCVDSFCEGACCADALPAPIGDANAPVMPGAYVAWPYVPINNVFVKRIELFTTGGGINLTSAKPDGPPPSSWLLVGTLEDSESPAWVGASIKPPMKLLAGNTYWIIQERGDHAVDQPLSVLLDGDFVPGYVTDDPGKSWSGPRSDLRLAANIIVDCDQ